MPSIQFKEIYSSFLLKARPSNLYNMMSEETRKEYVKGWIHAACADSHILKLYSALSYTDPSVDEDGVEIDGCVTYELKDINSATEQNDRQFTLNLFAQKVYLSWFENLINTPVNAVQIIGTASDKFYSQSNHVTTLLAQKKENQIELNKMIRDRSSYSNSYLSSSKKEASS